MKRIFFSLLLIIVSALNGLAQTPKEVLDKCASVIGSTDGFKASFRMESAQYGNYNGTIVVKGRKFYATTPVASMWFDGTTQWTYLQRNDEVSVTNPTEAQLQAINPYNFLNMYKQGYKYTMTSSDVSFRVHLTATEAQRKIQEVFITISKKNYHPSEIKMRQGQKWTTFYVSDLKIGKQEDSIFKFDSKDFPTAEIIDLR